MQILSFTAAFMKNHRFLFDWLESIRSNEIWIVDRWFCFYYRDNYLIICILHFHSFAAVSDPMTLLIFCAAFGPSVFRRWIFIQSMPKWIELKLTLTPLEGTWLVNEMMNQFNGFQICWMSNIFEEMSNVNGKSGPNHHTIYDIYWSTLCILLVIVQ